ncbi:MAG: WG repeat-containing protein [Saprospiraceae bacterium]
MYTINYNSCKNEIDTTEQNELQKINEETQKTKLDSLAQIPSIQVPETQKEILIESPSFHSDSEIELAVKCLLSDSSSEQNEFEELIIERKFEKALKALDLAQISDTEKDKSYYFNNRRKSIYLVKQYDDIDNAWISFPRTLILTEKDSKYGLFDREGNEVSKPKFDNIDPIFFGNLYCTELSGMYGFFDEQGKEIFKPIFSDVDPTRYDNMLIVKKGDLYGILDFDGNYILKPIFEEFIRVWSDVILTNTNGKWGAIDLVGNEIIENKYDELEYIKREEVYYAEINGKNIYLDKTGKVTKNPALN